MTDHHDTGEPAPSSPLWEPAYPYAPPPTRMLPPAVEGQTAEMTYQQPAMSVHATFLATDGHCPEEVNVVWRELPDREMLGHVFDLIASTAQGGRVVISTEPVLPPDDVPEPYTDPAVCYLTGYVNEGHTHQCHLTVGHDPVEPSGREHRCGSCGGVFMADAEVVDVAGSGRIGHDREER